MRRKVPNFDLNNKEDYSINVIGKPESISALLVMKLYTDDAKSNLNHWINYFKRIPDSEQKQFALNEKLIQLPKLVQKDYYKIKIVDKNAFNMVMAKYPVPENIYPHKSPSGEVVFNPRYFMVDQPAKIVIKSQLLFNWGHYINIPISESGQYLCGIPTEQLGVTCGFFDCRIQLNKTVFESLTFSNAVEVDTVCTRQDVDEVKKSMYTKSKGV